MVPMKRASVFRVISASDFWGRRRLSPLTLVVLGLLYSQAAVAQQVLPQGGDVVQGDVAIATPGAGHMVLDQGSDRAIVNWNSFSIGRDSTVDINQPGRTSAILNRVTGDTSSEIHGRLNATGEVFVVNPNGLMIGPNGEVTAGGGFVGSTLDITDDDFMQGRLRFNGLGSSAGVTNAGRVVIGRGGYAALLGGRVSNSGVVMVPMGQIGLGAGERATLDVSGDRFLQIEVPSQGDTDEMRALIENAGTLAAQGGTIEMRAATARNAARHAINLSGVADASSVSVRGGVITLGGGAGGTVTVSGTATTRGAQPRNQAIIVEQSARPPQRRGGGDVVITGRDIRLTGAQVDAGGGEGVVLIGGDFQGGGILPLATYLGVDAATRINADAGQTGDGGRVILWSDVHTEYAGQISARGGTLEGDGGFVEVSGKRTLAFNGLVDTSAANGAFGTLLLDPYNITIADAPNDNAAIVTGSTSPPDPVFAEAVPFGDDSVISVTQIQDNLAFGNVIVQTGTPGVGTQNGNITVADDVTWTAATTLEFEALGDVAINAGITGPFGGFTITAEGAITTGPAGTVNVGTFSLLRGDWSQEGPVLPAFGAVDFRLDDDQATSFLRVTGGTGDAATPYILDDIFGLQGIGSSGLEDRSFVLGGPISAVGTELWNSGEGFRPIDGPRSEGPSESGFTGSLDGQGNSVTDLSIDRFSNTGLFSRTTGATISNLTLADVEIFGSENVGALVARAADTVIDNVTVTGTVDAVYDEGSPVPIGFPTVIPFGGNVGGLVGVLSGGTSEISNSSFEGNVETFVETAYVLRQGGLVGLNLRGTILDSSFNGLISVDSQFNSELFVGGAVGFNSDTVERVSTQGTLSAAAEEGGLAVGGLVGESDLDGAIFDSNSEMTLEALSTSEMPITAGGLVGENAGTVAGSQATGNLDIVSLGGTVFAGGLIGVNEESETASVTDVLASGSVSVLNAAALEGSGSTAAGGLIGSNFSELFDVRATGDVSVEAELTRSSVGGLVGSNNNGTSGESTSITVISVAAATGVVEVQTDVDAFVGGFAGENSGTIRDALASGNVSLSTPGFRGDPLGNYLSTIGGFAGENRGTALRTAARGTVDVNIAGVTAGVGGHTGSNDFGEITDSYATGAVSGRTNVEMFLGGLVGGTADGAISNTFASGVLFLDGGFGSAIGGLIGSAQSSSDPNFPTTSVTGSFFDTSILGTPSDPATNLGTGLSTAEFEDTEGFIAFATIAGWDFDSTWAPGAVGRYPALFSIDPVIFAEPDPLDLTYGGTIGARTSGTITNGPLGYVFAPDGDTLEGERIFETLTFSAQTVGSQTYTVDTTPLTSAQGDVYAVVALPGAVEIRPAPLELTPRDDAKTYGEELLLDQTAFDITGGELFFDDSVTEITVISDGTSGFAPVGEGTYDIIGLAPAFETGLENYNVTFGFGTLTVARADLEVTANDRAKTYGEEVIFDGTAFSITSGEVFNSDNIGSFIFASEGAADVAPVGTGTYAITGALPLGGEVGPSDLEKYNLSFGEGTLRVDPAALQLTVADRAKTYGETVNFDGTEFAVTGGALLFDDSVEPIAIASEGAAAAAPVGTGSYAITGTVPATGTGAENYAITVLDGTLSVDPAALTVTPDDREKTEGDDLALGATAFTTSGLVLDDRVDSVDLASDGAAAAAPDGAFDILASNARGVGLLNYDLAFGSGTLTVVPSEPEVEDPTEFTPETVPTFTLPNPNDSLSLSLVNDFGSGTVLGGSGNAAQSGAERAQAEIALAAVEELSTVLNISPENCSGGAAGVNSYLACLSDSLDTFANELDAISTDLPPGLENVASIVRDARQSVSQARTRAEARLATATTDAQRQQIRRDAVNEARSALDTAATEIRKAIAFVRADDPELAEVQRATITSVAATVDNAGIALSRVVEL